MKLFDALSPDETLLWRGSPFRGPLVRRQDFILLFASIAWGGFAIVLAIMFIALTGFVFVPPEERGWRWWIFLVFIVMLILFAIYIILGRLVVEYWLRLHTIYAVTNKRALILRGLFARRVKTISLCGDVQVTLLGKRRGSIVFGYNPAPGRSAMRRRIVWHGPPQPFIFEKIREVEAVYRLIVGIQQGCETHSSLNDTSTGEA
jgi:hypothetical protein